MTKVRFSLKAGLAFIWILFAACNPVAKYINSQDVLRWEAHMQRFDSLNAVEYSDANTVLVTGSSSVRLWDSIHVDLAPYQVMQRGYGTFHPAVLQRLNQLNESYTLEKRRFHLIVRKAF